MYWSRLAPALSSKFAPCTSASFHYHCHHHAAVFWYICMRRCAHCRCVARQCWHHALHATGSDCIRCYAPCQVASYLCHRVHHALHAAVAWFTLRGTLSRLSQCCMLCLWQWQAARCGLLPCGTQHAANKFRCGYMALANAH